MHPPVARQTARIVDDGTRVDAIELDDATVVRPGAVQPGEFVQTNLCDMPDPWRAVDRRRLLKGVGIVKGILKCLRIVAAIASDRAIVPDIDGHGLCQYAAHQ